MMGKKLKNLFFRNTRLFSGSARRKENLSLYRASRKANSADCPNLPLTLLVEVTSKCNLSCRMCNIHYDTRSGIIMDERLLEQTFELSKIAHAVNPFGLGEPLLHPQIVRIVGRYKAQGAFVGLITNGMLLSEKISGGLVENRLDQLVISVDAADPVLFSEIRRGADLQIISDNVAVLNRLKKAARAGNPSLALNVVVQAINFSQLPHIIQLAEKWEVRFITFAPVTIHEHIAGIQDKALGPGLDKWRETLEFSMSEAGSRGISLDIRRLRYVMDGTPPDELYREMIPCPEPFRFAGIRANGDLFPCCNWDLGDPMSTLSATEGIAASDFEKAWRSPKWQELRDMVVSGRYPDQCRKCMKNFTRPFSDENSD